jgi:hypothetical protein
VTMSAAKSSGAAGAQHGGVAHADRQARRSARACSAGDGSRASRRLVG